MMVDKEDHITSDKMKT